MLLVLLLLVLLGGVAMLAKRDIGSYRRRNARRQAQWEAVRWRPQFRKIMFADRWTLRKTQRLTDQRMTARDEA